MLSSLLFLTTSTDVSVFCHSGVGATMSEREMALVKGKASEGVLLLGNMTNVLCGDI